MKRSLSFVFWIPILICGFASVNGLARRRELSALAENQSDSSAEDAKFFGGFFKPPPAQSNPICVIARQNDLDEDQNEVVANPAYPWALGFSWLRGARRPTRPPWRSNSSWMNATTTRSPRLPGSPPSARARQNLPTGSSPLPGPPPPTTPPTSYPCYPPPTSFPPPPALPPPPPPIPPIVLRQMSPSPPLPPLPTPPPYTPSYPCYPPPTSIPPPPALPPPSSPLLRQAPGLPTVTAPLAPLPPTPPSYICYCTPPPPPGPGSPPGPLTPTPLPTGPSSSGGTNCIIVNTGKSTNETKLESRIILHKRRHRSLMLRRELQKAAKRQA